MLAVDLPLDVFLWGMRQLGRLVPWLLPLRTQNTPAPYRHAEGLSIAICSPHSILSVEGACDPFNTHFARLAIELRYLVAPVIDPMP